jgi:hypothetical protein
MRVPSGIPSAAGTAKPETTTEIARPGRACQRSTLAVPAPRLPPSSCAEFAPADDAAVVSLDLRAAVHGAVSMRVNQPHLPWPPLEEQVDRFLAKLVGLTHATHPIRRS